MPLLLLVMSWAMVTCAEAAGADAQAPDPAADPAVATDTEYHTPLAGRKAHATFMGKKVDIPGYDRNHLNAITLGGSLLVPRQGTTAGLPVAALYFRHYWDSSRTRDVVSVAVDELEYDKSFGKLDLVGHFENYTLPGDITELSNNKEMKGSAVTWGTVIGSLGPGFRLKVSPFEPDNEFILQLLGRIGYFYAERSHETGPDVVVPPSTLLYGARARLRYDSFLRNLLELPHQGYAVGIDFDYMRRDTWRHLTRAETDSINHDYLQVHGYLETATGVPGGSERDRLLFYVNGGKTSNNSADRFNAFLVNGGPFPSEADDLIRPHYSGQLHDDVRATSFVTGSVAYRRELAFFLYLSLIGSGIWGDRVTVQGLDNVVFHDRTGGAATVELDSGFFWRSQLSVNYTWESGFIRDGRSGGGITVFWSKLF